MKQIMLRCQQHRVLMIRQVKVTLQPQFWDGIWDKWRKPMYTKHKELRAKIVNAINNDA